jgi:hygromycin-B 7''-O-kinase
MTTTHKRQGDALAEVRARRALRGAGLDPSVPLVRSSSVTNEVWLSPTHAVRVNRRPTNRLYREALVAAALPPEVGYPAVVAHGGGRGADWLVADRVPGVPLAHVWPDLSELDRERAVEQLAMRLAAIHRTPAPAALPPIDHAPQLLDLGTPDPTGPLLVALDEAMRLPHVDRTMLARAREQVVTMGDALLPCDAPTLIHGDLTFENVLWHEGDVTALLDLEWARPAPADLDLDILLRCAAYPHLHVADIHADRTRADDYLDVPWQLGRTYPALFDHPRQIDRMRVYSIAYDVRDLLAAPPQVAVRHLPELHAHHRLERVVTQHSYLDTLTRGRV